MKIYFKMIFTLLFGFSTSLIFGQLPDPPPNEVPVNNSIAILFIIAIVLATFYLVKITTIKTTKE